MLIENVNSLNDTFVKQTRLFPDQQSVLQPNDVIQICTVQMSLTFSAYPHSQRRRISDSSAHLRCDSSQRMTKWHATRNATAKPKASGVGIALRQ